MRQRLCHILFWLLNIRCTCLCDCIASQFVICSCMEMYGSTILIGDSNWAALPQCLQVHLCDRNLIFGSYIIFYVSLEDIGYFLLINLINLIWCILSSRRSIHYKYGSNMLAKDGWSKSTLDLNHDVRKKRVNMRFLWSEFAVSIYYYMRISAESI